MNDPIGQLFESSSSEAYGRLEIMYNQAVRVTESPIEALFLAAFVFTIKLNELHVGATYHNLIDVIKFGDEIPDTNFSICPQYKWEGYRIDFAVFKSGHEIVPIFVECDGHDFHERTKEQAKRDRKKDRDAQAAGHKIFRFTGSEIYADPFECARLVQYTAISLEQDKLYALQDAS